MKPYCECLDRRRGWNQDGGCGHCGRVSRMVWDKTNFLHVVSFDPGGVSGWAWFHVRARAFHPQRKIIPNIIEWKAGEYEGEDHSQVDQMLKLIDPLAGRKTLHIVTEDYIPLKLTGKDGLSPVRLNAMLDREVRTRYGTLGLAVAYQEPDARATPDQLALWGFKVTGKDAKSAVGHGIVYLRRLKAQRKARK